MSDSISKNALGGKLYTQRFYLLFFTLLLNFFIPPLSLFPLLKVLFKLFTLTILLLSAANFIQKDKTHLRNAWFIFGIINILIALLLAIFPGNTLMENIHYILLSIFFLVISISLQQQIFSIREVTKDVIIGSFCGYLLLGIISFFIFALIEISAPNSLSGLNSDFNEKIPQVFYFSFTCLTTIGFGDILPVTSICQKLAVFTGALGQFYIAVVVAILVSRFMKIADKQKGI